MKTKRQSAAQPRASGGPQRRPLYGVIMAGGQGTRFWPLSRKARPKQFLDLLGSKSLLRNTAERLLPLTGWDRMLVVTHRQYFDAVRRELPELGDAQVLLEPEGKNTFPCLLLAASWIRRHEPDALMLAVPADHLIAPTRSFLRDIRVAERVARSHSCLVTLGIPPARVETGYGYIECGEPLTTRSRPAEGFWVRRFHEKPDARTAQRYVRSRRFLWNSGMFVWSLWSFRDAVEQVAPGTWDLWESAVKGNGSLRPARVRALYAETKAESVDVALLERLAGGERKSSAPRVAVVPARFRWSDLGSWQEVAELLPKNGNGNVERGRVISVRSQGCLAWSEGRVLALVGVNDLIVVDTLDSLLVCSKSHAQEVRAVVAELQRKKWLSWL